MKRRLWIVALIPLLLLGVAVWARKAAWERLEGELREEILADATRNSRSSFVVSVIKWQRTTNLATLTLVQLKSVLADVHLQKVAPRTSSDDFPASTSLRFATFAGKPEPISGFTIEVASGAGPAQAKAGYVAGSWTSRQFTDKWQSFELTPASTGVLKRRMWKQYGAKLRALHIPPPP